MKLELEKESLRNLSGPQLALETRLEPMPTPDMQALNGGGFSEAVSGVVSGVVSFVVSAAVSVIDSIPTDEGVSAVASAVISRGASEEISGAFQQN